MLGDPEINLTISNQTRINGGPALLPMSYCDACEADQYGYKIGLVLVSDFVLPTWSQPSWPSKAYDFMSHLHGPVPTLLPGGYIGVFPIPNRHGWLKSSMPIKACRECTRPPIVAGPSDARRRIN